MKKTTLLTILLLFGFAQGKLAAQQTAPVEKDSISIGELIDLVEAKSDYRVYTNLEPGLKVYADKSGDSPLKLLKSAFDGTEYMVSTYGKKIYILAGELLDTRYMLSLDSQQPDQPDRQLLPAQVPVDMNMGTPTETSASENRVYTIGNRYSKEKPAKSVLKGKVTTFKTGEPIPGVTIVLKDPYVACTTDGDGNYSIELPTGRVKLDVSGFTFRPTTRQLMLYGDGNLNIEMMEDVKMLEEVTVYADRINSLKSTQIGVETMEVAKIKNVPMALGEVDLLRAIQTLPGVKTVGEASTGFNVRGGATDQNLILLNNGTIYNPNHLFGFFTAFSVEMVDQAELFKSSIPAKYGGRISSVLNITGKEASKEKFTGSAGIGLVTSNLNLEMPIAKNKTSLLLTGRTTYSDWILKALPDDSGYNDGTANFYDLGAVFSHDINRKNQLNVYGYYSHDQFSFSKHEKYGYTNLNASAKWRTIFNDRFLLNFSAGYDHYDYLNKETAKETEAFKLTFDINQFFAKADFTYDLGDHRIDFGLNTILYQINAGTLDPVGEASLMKPDKLQEEKALESAIYVSDEWAVTPKFSINAGIRYSMFNAMGPRTYNKYLPGKLPSEGTVSETVDVKGNKIFKTYQGPEFRLSARYMLQDNLSLKAGFNTMRQYIHKLSNTVIMSPTDTWKLSDANIKPQTGWQAATGLYYTIPKKDVEASVEVYYKRMNDYLDYRGGAKLIMNHHIETDVVSTEGYAYGAEFSVKKMSGKLNGWISYTYSRTFLRQSDKMITNPINDGAWYPTNYDKPHDFKFVGNYKFTQRFSLSLNVDYSTGRPTTVPAGKYFNPVSNSIQVYYTDRNTFRIPDYFRGDIAFNIEPTHRKTALVRSKISIGVYNFTGRKNVYSIYYVNEGGSIKGYQLSIFGAPIPYVTYSLKF